MHTKTKKWERKGGKRSLDIESSVYTQKKKSFRAPGPMHTRTYRCQNLYTWKGSKRTYTRIQLNERIQLERQRARRRFAKCCWWCRERLLPPIKCCWRDNKKMYKYVHAYKHYKDVRQERKMRRQVYNALQVHIYRNKSFCALCIRKRSVRNWQCRHSSHRKSKRYQRGYEQPYNINTQLLMYVCIPPMYNKLCIRA